MQLGKTGLLASDVFVTEGSFGASVSVAEGGRVKLLPGTTATGEAIVLETGASETIVTLKFIVPTLDGEPVITVSGGNGWEETEPGSFTKNVPAEAELTLGDFGFTLDSRIDVVDGEMVIVEKGEIEHLDWNGIEKGYVKIVATTGILSSGN